MRQSFSVLLALVVAASLTGGAHAHEGEPGFEVPLGNTKLSMGNEKLKFSGKWIGEVDALDPAANTSSLQVTGCGGADTGQILLDPQMWSPMKKGNGFVYGDKAGTVAGIRSIALKHTKKGGKLKVSGKGSPVWNVDGEASEVLVTITIADDKWCAVMDKVKNKNGKIRASGKVFPDACPSTWGAVQEMFERNGCTNDICHGNAMEGGLDLRADVAYANLVNVFSEQGQKDRVKPGSRQDSFLWEKLAAATEGYDLEGRGSPMPSGGNPITAEELELVRLWIQFGANETGVVTGTESLVGACLPDPDPPTIQAPAPPPAGQGVQLHVPQWTIPPASEDGPNGEGEVCYSVWYDFSEQIPAQFKAPCPEFWGGPSRECFFFNKTELTQTPNSHHSILHIYKGAYDLTWEPGPSDRADGFQFRCQAGAMQGEACDPREASACGGNPDVCYGNALSKIACLGYGPPDFSRGLNPNGGASLDNAPSVGGSQQPYILNDAPPGAFGMLPVSGVFVANSHAFNLFDTPQTNEQWWHVWFANEADRVFPIKTIFDATDIFVQLVPPFEEREYCRTVTMPKGARVFEVSSHTHVRGRLFRIWGPGIAESCRSTTENPEACLPEPTDPIVVTTEYNDPNLLRLLGDKMHVLDSDDPADRRYKFCSIFDNGFTNPDLIKRNSTSPVPPQFGNLAPGGKCYYQNFNGTFTDIGISCLNGPLKGQPCGGDDSVCDSAPGAGDGICDACPLRGGVTTDDEMFIMLGNFYCAPGSDCERGVCIGGANQGLPCDGDDAVCGTGGRCGPYTN